MYIRDADLAKYGYTVGCRRCRLMRDGLPAVGVHHIPACRARVEEAMRQDDDERLRRADDRRDEEIARRLRDSEQGVFPEPETVVEPLPQGGATRRRWGVGSSSCSCTVAAIRSSRA